MRPLKSPYPTLGTPEGDEYIGFCSLDGCDMELRRGDIFVTMQHGNMVCWPCYDAMEPLYCYWRPGYKPSECYADDTVSSA